MKPGDFRRERKFDNYSKTALVATILDTEDRLQAELAEVTGRIDAFFNANVFVRLWWALRGRVS